MVNGLPTCANPKAAAMLRDPPPKGWGFEGYITSDSDACATIYQAHHFVKTAEEAVALCLAGAGLFGHPLRPDHGDDANLAWLA